MNARPRILYVCSAWPRDQAYGGQLRALHVGRTLQQIGDVSLLVVSSDTDIAAARRQTAEEFRVLPPIHPRVAPNRSVLKKLRWALDPRFLNVHGTVASPEDRQRLLGLAREHDVVWVMNARTPSILQVWRWPRTHLDIDDAPSSHARPAADAGWAARWKAQTQRALLRRRERRFRERFTTLSVCSAADRAQLGDAAAHVIPNGFPRPRTDPARRAAAHSPRIGFIGLGSYAPNADGVRWFLQHAWPAVRRAVPGVRFRLAGKDTAPLLAGGADVDALGWLADPADEIATWSAMAIPIRLGGGTRIKVADAFSRKCPVVATRFGVHGYDVESGRHLLLADDGPAFAAACIELLRNPTRAAELAESAWREFLAHWTWEAIAPRIAAAVNDCLRRSATAAPV